METNEREREREHIRDVISSLAFGLAELADYLDEQTEPAPEPEYKEGEWLVIDNGKLISCLCQFQQPHNRVKDCVNVIRTDGSVTVVEASILRSATPQDFVVERGGVPFIAYDDAEDIRIRIVWEDGWNFFGPPIKEIFRALFADSNVPICPMTISKGKFEAPEEMP